MTIAFFIVALLMYNYYPCSTNCIKTYKMGGGQTKKPIRHEMTEKKSCARMCVCAPPPHTHEVCVSACKIMESNVKG